MDDKSYNDQPMGLIFKTQDLYSRDLICNIFNVL